MNASSISRILEAVLTIVQRILRSIEARRRSEFRDDCANDGGRVLIDLLNPGENSKSTDSNQSDRS